jgi:hypothetical protein
MYYDAQGQLRSILTSWTSLHELDSFMAASSGRSWFRVDDLLQLSALTSSRPSTTPPEAMTGVPHKLRR